MGGLRSAYIECDHLFFFVSYKWTLSAMVQRDSNDICTPFAHGSWQRQNLVCDFFVCVAARQVKSVSEKHQKLVGCICSKFKFSENGGRRVQRNV